MESPNRKRRYTEFELQTEWELARIFRRIPRDDPRPDDVPYYPYLQEFYHQQMPRVNFNLGFNPFAIN